MGGWETIWPPATREVARLLGGTKQRLRDYYEVQNGGCEIFIKYRSLSGIGRQKYIIAN